MEISESPEGILKGDKEMTIKRLIPAVAAACLMVAPALAAKECSAGKVTSESYTWNFKQEASKLLDNVRRDASEVQDHAAKLESFENIAEVHWQSHAEELNGIKAAVNRMSENLCRLETIKPSTSEWQRGAIDTAMKTEHLLASEATAGIGMVNARGGDLWSPEYGGIVRALYTNSSELQARIGRLQALANAKREVRELQDEVNAGL
ncbi:MAG: hypothetical protein R2762_29705 [Bryobacteraceae bacterium]